MNFTATLGLFLAVGAWADPMVASTRPPTRLPAASVRAKTDCALMLDIKLSKGWRLDAKTPLIWRITETYAGFSFTRRKEKLLSPKLPIRIPFRTAPGATGARLVVNFRYCPESGNSSCSDGNADYLVVLQADEKETRTEIPVEIKVDKL